VQYLLLIYSAERDEPKPGTPEFDAHLTAYTKFTEDVGQKNVLVGGNALDSVSTATTVRVRGGRTQTTDGPFAETKEQLGGYYLLECKDLDEAIAWAAKIPSARFGSVEVRPIMVFS
jgi:hypothetical protein